MLLLTFACALLCLCWWADQWYRRRKVADEVAKGECAKLGCDYGPVEHAFDSWQFPFQRCRRCGHQKHLSTCTACGAKVDPVTRKVVCRAPEDEDCP